MLMLQMSGGMGNQMFVYALYKALQYAGKEVSIEDFTHYQEIGRLDNNLQEIFPIEYLRGDKDEYNRLTDSSMQLRHRVRRKICGRKGKVYTERDAIIYEREIFGQEDCYCVGYWQSQRYFLNIARQLRKEFVFDWTGFSGRALQYKEQIEAGCSVSVHIRRGDYLNKEFEALYGGICTEDYYSEAMDYFRKRYEGCKFYLFTNDAEWGREYAKDDMVPVDCSDTDGAHADMALMSRCRHNIIANSSFSWWGAWLNDNAQKTVIAPAKWLNNSNGQDIYYGLCDIKVDSKGHIV